MKNTPLPFFGTNRCKSAPKFSSALCLFILEWQKNNSFFFILLQQSGETVTFLQGPGGASVIDKPPGLAVRKDLISALSAVETEVTILPSFHNL